MTYDENRRDRSELTEFLRRLGAGEIRPHASEFSIVVRAPDGRLLTLSLQPAPDESDTIKWEPLSGN